jgi:hypothetical protein
MLSEGSRESCNLGTVFGVESIRENKLGCIYCAILLWHHACTVSSNIIRDFTSADMIDDQVQGPHQSFARRTLPIRYPSTVTQ